MTRRTSAAFSQPFPVSLPPQKTESLSSWLTRLAHYYGFSRYHDFLASQPISYSVGTRDVDRDLPDLLAERLAHFTRTPLSVVTDLVAAEAWLMRPKYRTAVCLLCWLDDFSKVRPPYRRAAWGRPLALCCLLHRFPLLDMHALPESRTACLKQIESIIYNAASASTTSSCVVDALIDLEMSVAKRFSGQPAETFLGLFGFLITLLHNRFGLWDYEKSRGYRIKLYQFEARGALSWQMMFGNPLARDDEKIPEHVAQLHLISVPSVGYRRQLLYGALDLLTIYKRNEGDLYSILGDDAYRAELKLKERWPAYINTMSGFAEIIMRSHYVQDDLEDVEYIAKLDARLEALSAP